MAFELAIARYKQKQQEFNFVATILFNRVLLLKTRSHFIEDLSGLRVLVTRQDVEEGIH